MDISDQMSSYFSPLRKSVIWYNKVAIELLLSTSVVNALIVYTKLTNRKMKIKNFREELVKKLLGLNLEKQKKLLLLHVMLQKKQQKNYLMAEKREGAVRIITLPFQNL